MTDIPYNPLDRKNLGASVAEALIAQPVLPLADVISTKFEGSGIYVLYYVGAFPAYSPLAQLNWNGKYRLPIYIGKAIPEGARKGGGQGKKKRVDRALYKRLNDHAGSIEAATSTLQFADFHCQYLLVEDIWIPLGESLLIAKFVPVWNLVAEGFGNHAPGGGRYSGKIPLWDVLHPGRNWASKCKPRDETPADVAGKVAAHFRETLESASAEVQGAATFAQLAEDAPVWLGPENSDEESTEENGSE